MSVPRISLAASVGLAAALAVAFVLAPQPAGACACGIALEAEVSEERALVIDGDGSEEIVLSLDLAAEGDARAAVVLPVPGEPEVAAIEGPDPLAYLEQATAPPVQATTGAGADEGAAAPVDVIGREQVGGYDVARLRASDPGALDEWLDDNGYSLPDGAEPILAGYVEKGWSYVAIRLAPGSEGALKPLRVSFPTTATHGELVYPMRLARLGTEPVELTLFVLADGQPLIHFRTETFSRHRTVRGGVFAGPASDFPRTAWSGRVSELEPPPPPALEDLFARGSHLTRVEISVDPASIASDIKIGDAAEAGSPLQPGAAAPEIADEKELSNAELALLGLAALGLAVALALAASRRPSG